MRMRKVYSLLKLREEKEKFNKIHIFTRVEREILDVCSPVCQNNTKAGFWCFSPWEVVDVMKSKSC